MGGFGGDGGGKREWKNQRPVEWLRGKRLMREIFLCLGQHAFPASACPGVLGITREKLEGFKVQGQGFVGPVEFKGSLVFSGVD